VPAEEAGGDGGGTARREGVGHWAVVPPACFGKLLLQEVRNRILIVRVPVVLHLELGRLLLDDLRART
jgi:hypothetical protein